MKFTYQYWFERARQWQGRLSKLVLQFVFDDFDSVCGQPALITISCRLCRVHTLAPENPHGQCEVPMICASSQLGVEEIRLGFIGC
jgi:hypothetical protein